MKSTILTKVNSVTPRNFAQQIEWMSLDAFLLHTDDDFSFLQSFVRLCHRKTAYVFPTTNPGTFDAHTGRGSYRYTIYSKHIVRTDLNTTKKKFYQIS